MTMVPDGLLLCCVLQDDVGVGEATLPEWEAGPEALVQV